MLGKFSFDCGTCGKSQLQVSPDKLGDRLGQSPAGSTGTVREAASLGEFLALAVKRIAARNPLELANAGNLAGKTAMMDVIRATMIAARTFGLL